MVVVFQQVQFKVPRNYIFYEINKDLFLETKATILMRDENSLCQLIWQQNFWMTTNQKTSLKNSICTVPNFINVYTQFYLICKILVKLSGVTPERNISGLEKEKENFVLCSPTP